MPMTSTPVTGRPRQLGVTLIEMMVAIAVLAILLAIAVPSFNDFRQRSALRGATEQLVAVLANARFESVKRNTAVTVNFQRGSSDSAWCAGAIVGSAACDCFQKDTAGVGYCSVALYPPLDNSLSTTAEAQAKTVLKGVEMNTNPASAMAGDSAITFDPLSGALANLSDGGTLTMQSPSMGYQLQFTVNALGRTALCVPATARNPIGYSSC